MSCAPIKRLGIPRFDDSIDWGNILYYITGPFFALLNWLKTQIGSFGWAILASPCSSEAAAHPALQSEL